jgi:Ni/Fe-hydrogenase subunit HybB-like protein
MKLRINLHPALHLSPLAWVLLALMMIGFVVSMTRFALGIGPISNLNNTYPWGFWISFDLFTGVAISSGGFIMAGLVYILQIQEFKPLLRPSVLTALLGYLMVAIALMVDLGHPERIWYMMVYWNHTSVLLEIGICVMAYLTVLSIEFAPVVFEGMKWEKPARFIHKFIMPFVILGVVLSTLHQSSLGSLLLIQLTKLHPLWWTPILPVMFFTSALTIGLSMIILESSLSARYFKRGLETHLLEKLARAIPYTAGAYLVLKLVDLAFAGELSLLFSSGWMSLLFWAEILISCIAPMVLFSMKKVRQSPNGLLVGASITLLGMIFNRFNVSWFAVGRLNEVAYAPSLVEMSVSVAIFSAGILAFGLAAKYLPLFEAREPHELAPVPAPATGE